MGSRAGAAGQAVSADGTSLPQLDAPLQMCASLELPRARGWFYGLEAAVPSRQETMCKGLIVLIRASLGWPAQCPCARGCD